MKKRRSSYATMQQTIKDRLPRTYGPIMATIYRHGWIDGSLCAIGEMPRFESTRMNVPHGACRREDIDYIARRTALEWEEDYGQVSFNFMTLKQWLTLEEVSSLIFYKKRAAITEARKWKSMLKTQRVKKYKPRRKP